MAFGSKTPSRPLASAYRGQHASAEPAWSGMDRRTRVALIGGAVVAVALVATATFLPPSGEDTSRLLPPLPARISPLPMVPAPIPQPSGPPGFPSPLPTGDASSPTPAPTTSRPVPAPTAGPSVAPFSIEAEAATNVLSGAARIRAVSAASGGEVIAYIGGAPDNALRFNRIVVPSAGVYTMAIHYISGEDRDAFVSVNDGRFIRLRFPATNDWDTIGSLTLRVKLDRGINSIQFGNASAYAPDIDRIVIGS